jgi:D-alanyl-D-alanine carboxypeptidase
MNPRYAAEERLRRDGGRFADAEKLDYFTARERVGYLAELPLRSAPGAQWSYNQPGYILLGAIIERVTGQPFAAFMRSRLFEPLGMRSARYGDSRVVIARRRQVAYTRQYGPFQNWLWPYATSDYPAAGLNMRAADAARLFSALDRGLLRPATCARMWDEVATDDGKRSGYALGWTVNDLRGRKVVGHEGGGCAWISHAPSERLTVVVLSNLAGSGADLGEKTLGLLLAG